MCVILPALPPRETLWYLNVYYKCVANYIASLFTLSALECKHLFYF